MVKADYEVQKQGVKLPPVDRELFELPSSAFEAEVEHDNDGNPKIVELAEERKIMFAQPGRPVRHDVLYTVKAVKPDGTIIQIPLEDQINNQIASPENVIGLQGAVRKGYLVLWDFGTNKGVFCPTKDCWAKWNDDISGFCSTDHRNITSPEGNVGGFGEGATTSRTWSM
jgi:hypothetical protein